MLFDLVHLYRDAASQHAPCRSVGMTVDLPADTPHGIEITPRRVRWPGAQDGTLVVCGACGGYFGESLNDDCIRPHRCLLIQRPDGRLVCRAGCDGGK
jgi:hypothetical protein